MTGQNTSSTDIDQNRPKPAAILFLTFNRPDLFQRTLDVVRKAGPREIFVSIDGPRTTRPSDLALCQEVSKIARKIDWASKVYLKIEQKNIGCGPAVASAIQWALDQVPEIIVLEDDCLPDSSFLKFCDELLERYRDDERVMQISGTNWGAAAERYGEYSYAFNAFAPIWGWATWRRAWKFYEFKMDSWPRIKSSGVFEGMALSKRFRKIMEYEWDRIHAHGGTWDHQWQYAVLRNNGLCVSPRGNLVSNTGFREDATAYTGGDRVFSHLPLEQLSFPLWHPPEVARNASVEFVFEKIYWQKLGWPIRLY
ncbi:MAG: glycosyltransferase family A protein, partial [Stenotrophobium sp.]